MSPRAERKVHVLLELACDWGAAGFGGAAAVAGNRPDAMGARANATETPAAAVLRSARIPLRKVPRVNLRMLKIGRSIDTPPRNKQRLSLYYRELRGGLQRV